MSGAILTILGLWMIVVEIRLYLLHMREGRWVDGNKG